LPNKNKEEKGKKKPDKKIVLTINEMRGKKEERKKGQG